jgi:DNA/RNA-binding domain of Phe-tRNA-synthetase-like protein
MEITIDKEAKTRNSEILIGYAIIEGVSIDNTQKPLKKEIMSVINSVKDKYHSRAEMYATKPIKEIRDLFKKTGIDPSRYTPSAEALLKRIIDGKDLYRINNVVECNNVGSMKFELPMGVYNFDRLVGDIVFKFGSDSDIMETMAKGEMNMKDILLTRDNEKLFGSPISDSPHAMITEDTKNVLLLVYGTTGIGKDYVSEATEYTARKITEYAGGVISKLEVIASE